MKAKNGMNGKEWQDFNDLVIKSNEQQLKAMQNIIESQLKVLKHGTNNKDN